MIGKSRDELSGALRSPLSDTPRREAVRCRSSTRSDLPASILAIFSVHGVEAGSFDQAHTRPASAEELGAAALHEAIGCIEDAAAEREPALGADRTGGVDGFGKRESRPEEVPRVPFAARSTLAHDRDREAELVERGGDKALLMFRTLGSRTPTFPSR